MTSEKCLLGNGGVHGTDNLAWWWRICYKGLVGLQGPGGPPSVKETLKDGQRWVTGDMLLSDAGGLLP